MSKLLVVEDDADLLSLLDTALRAQGHNVMQCRGGGEALSVLRAYKFDLIVLDWMMPDITGLDVCKQFRAMGGKAPILMLTAKASVDDKETCLDAGADDYLTKPFDNKELAARIRALLRRPSNLTDSIMRCGEIELDPARCEIRMAGTPVHVRPKVYDIVEFFMRHPNQIFSADAILERVWSDDSFASTDSVRTHMKLLRQTFPGCDLIETVRGKGYILRRPSVRE
ncbi:MAG: response regulator transcription factor [Candidatus Melainabacteria bacterium]|nr:response regulator transcription factor [Candidatus Melainabacteria bacterium]